MNYVFTTFLASIMLNACHKSDTSEEKGKNPNSAESTKLYSVDRSKFLEDTKSTAAWSEEEFGCVRSGFHSAREQPSETLDPLYASLPEESVDESKNKAFYEVEDEVYDSDRNAKKVKRLAYFSFGVYRKLEKGEKDPEEYANHRDSPHGYREVEEKASATQELQAEFDKVGDGVILKKNAGMDVVFGSKFGQRHAKLAGDIIPKATAHAVVKLKDGSYQLIKERTIIFIYSKDKKLAAKVPAYDVAANIDGEGFVKATNGKFYNMFSSVVERAGVLTNLNNRASSCLSVTRFTP